MIFGKKSELGNLAILTVNSPNLLYSILLKIY